jgi:hypothetical protein
MPGKNGLVIVSCFASQTSRHSNTGVADDTEDSDGPCGFVHQLSQLHGNGSDDNTYGEEEEDDFKTITVADAF